MRSLGVELTVLAVTWAQRSSKTDAEKNHVFLTIVVPDVTPANLKLDLQPTSLDFTGHSESRKATYHVKLDFFAEIDPKESKINHTTRAVELVLRKKELQEEFWPRLTKEKAKYHFLKTDFDKVRCSCGPCATGIILTSVVSGSTRTSRTTLPMTMTT